MTQEDLINKVIELLRKEWGDLFDEKNDPIQISNFIKDEYPGPFNDVQRAAISYELKYG